MAKESAVQQAASLRALAYRISSCPPKQLPGIAPQIAASLWNCRAILSSSSETAKANSEASQTANRFRTSISQLLQARSVEERWAAVVLAKAAIEAGGLEIVNKATGWTKNLIAILKKNDPPTTKILAIITLTRIFMLTWEDTNLVREITTPALPGFVQACFGSVEKDKASGKVLQATLEAFATLVPRHPTIFRTYEGQIRTLLVKILSTTASASDHERCCSQSHHDSARRLFVLLHHCAPKQGGPEKWSELLEATVTAAHTTCDRVFRSVNESWESNAGIVKTTASSTGELQSNAPDALGLSTWQGMHAGAERLVTLIQLLQAHMECTTSSTITIKLGLVIDLLRRVLELDASVRDQAASFNAQISKDEREELFATLPGIHTAILDLLDRMIHRFGNVIVSTLPHALEMLSAVFAAEASDVKLRTAAYRLLNTLLDRIGPSLPKDIILDIDPIIRTCCEDLLSPNQINLTDLHTAASLLLPTLFTKLDQSLLPAKLRVQTEQTAVLTRHKDALVASVLNPATKARGTRMRASLLPLLAREFPECAEVEALLRPRMPFIGVGGGGKVRVEEDAEEEEDESEEDKEEEEETESEDRPNGVNDVEDDDNIVVAHPSSSGNGPAGIPQQHQDVTSTNNNAHDEFFSTASEQAAAQTSTPQALNKRPAASIDDLNDTNAKRLRASPVASALVPEPAQSLPVADLAADVPVMTFVDGANGQQAATLPASNVAEVERDASDDSDFEIPPLTMESDSEEDGVDDEG